MSDRLRPVIYVSLSSFWISFRVFPFVSGINTAMKMLAMRISAAKMPKAVPVPKEVSIHG